MLFKVIDIASGGGRRLSMRCPGCRQLGTFEPITNIPDLFVRPGNWFVQRVCPNTACLAHVFAVHNNSGTVLVSYPPQIIDFDTKNIPAPIIKTFNEALTCHANGLHVATALMIRRTLEELCDNKGAKGTNLKDRISALQSVVVLPKELFIALDDMRLLGNDAAHLEAKTYDSVGESEISVAIELTKEVLKAVYQLDDLVARLRALKK